MDLDRSVHIFQNREDKNKHKICLKGFFIGKLTWATFHLGWTCLNSELAACQKVFAIFLSKSSGPQPLYSPVFTSYTIRISMAASTEPDQPETMELRSLALQVSVSVVPRQPRHSRPARSPLPSDEAKLIRTDLRSSRVD